MDKNKVQENNLLNDTVICLTADHYLYGLGETGTNSLNDLYGFDVAHSLLNEWIKIE